MKAVPFRELYSTMVRIRVFEGAVERLTAEGLLPAAVLLSRGQEAVAAGVCLHLGPGDQIASTHRPLAHLIAKGCDLGGLMAELLGRAGGLNGGKAGPFHVSDPSVGALGANGVVGASVPIAVGYALAHRLRGDNGVAAAFFGEGASNQGCVHEALNLAAVWSLPIVFVCENSSPRRGRMLGHEMNWPQLAVERVSRRAAAYGIPGETHDGLEAEDVYQAAGRAVERARRGEGPTLLEFTVERLEEAAIGGLRDPVERMRRRLLEGGVIDPGEDEAIWLEAEEEVEEAVDYALSSPEPELSDAFRDVFEEGWRG
ncbi:MAG: acetoin:2,6-dichlorophenolindophenol oxidoreductase subunit alpha [Candidatus Bathyarchaeota archaeon B23]|nr:MAG: acetoin:2,6-dichlorophenolindophenol oxidoreductase subunit alpha [Candidatus Bathyarchaeota archaeon B23]